MQPADQPTTLPYSVGYAPEQTTMARADGYDYASDVFDSLYIIRPRVWLTMIVVAYMISALLYAWNTPAWQSPDEPAHYNYIAHIAEERSLPVLRMGDYDQDLLERLKKSSFQPSAALNRVRYESHQPPLYYLAATPVYWVSGGNLFVLRLFSVLIGFGTLVLFYLCLELIFPKKTLIVVGGTAFAALLPMHVAMMSAVNNDGLAELLIVASMLVMLSWMRRRFAGRSNAGDDQDMDVAAGVSGRSRLLLLGILLGLGMLTKIYAYVLIPILFATVIIVELVQPQVDRHGRSQFSRPTWRNFWMGVRLSLWMLIPALLLGSVWWIRNQMVYGDWDLLGLAQHSLVVSDQPRSIDWIVIHGWAVYGERALTFTFRSFWGVFGWMGVFMDERVYTAFLLFTGVVFLGVLWAMVRMISGRPDADMNLLQIWVLALFGVMIAAVLGAFAWYNVEFMQHQGRYFFWGLLPIGTVVALGWREVMQPVQALITAVLVLVVAVGVTAAAMVTGGPYKWTVLTTGLIAMTLLFQSLLLVGTTKNSMRHMPTGLQEWLSRRRVASLMRWSRAVVWALPFILMFLLNLAVPFAYIVPQLTP